MTGATALVTGATSQLGVFVLPRLLGAGFRVVALSRAAPASAIETSHAVRWQHPEAFLAEKETAEQLPDSPQFLISCGPLELAGQLVGHFPAWRRVVAFSTSSVVTKADSADPSEQTLMRQIREMESSLVRRCETGDIPLLLLRPTLIYGCGLDRNVSLLSRLGRRFGVIPLSRQAQGLRQPVHADDLAGLAVRALQADKLESQVSAACGGSTISYREMAERIAAVDNGRVRIVALPAGILSVAVQVLAWLPAFEGANAEMVRRQQVDMVFDDAGIRDSLEYRPRPFRPGPEDFELPAGARQLQLGA